MNIEYENYIAYGKDDRFDLYKKVKLVAKKDGKDQKKGDEYDSEILIGYSYRFESLLRKIVEMKLSEKETTVTISEYIKAFKEELSKLQTVLK